MRDDRPIVCELRFAFVTKAEVQRDRRTKSANKRLMPRSKDALARLLRLTLSHPRWISVLADGHAATAVHHRCDRAAGGDHGLAQRYFYDGCSGGMERSQQFRGSSDEPSPIVNIEFHQTFAAHFQKEGLADFLIRDIGAFHDLVDFERLLAEHIQDILPIIQHDYSLQPRNPDVHS
jgi:hypothetical protein